MAVSVFARPRQAGHTTGCGASAARLDRSWNSWIRS